MTWKMTARDVAEIGVMSATLTAGKTVMSFLPNIEIVSFLIIMYAMYFGRKIFLSIFVFVAVECMIWGFNIWTVMYLYIWPFLAGITLLLKGHNGVCFGLWFLRCLDWPSEAFALSYMCFREALKRHSHGG